MTRIEKPGGDRANPNQPAQARAKCSTKPAGKKDYKRHPLIFPVSLHRYLKAQSRPFADLTARKQCYFAGMLYASHFRPHCHAHNENAQVHHWYERYLACKGSHMAAYYNLGWWTKTQEHDRMKKIAAGYELTPEGRCILDMWLSSLDDDNGGIMDAQGNLVRMPKTSVNPRTMTGSAAKREPSLKVPVEIDGDNLHRFGDAADNWVYREPAPREFKWAHDAWDAIEAERGRGAAEERVQKSKRQAAALGAMARSSKAPGHVIGQTYIEAPSGRLYSESIVNMQNCHREVKRAALHGCWEYDFENCHWDLLYQMARSASVNLESVKEYLSNKKEWRQRIAKHAGISEANAKQCIIAIIYGAGLRADKRLEIPKLVGIEAARLLGRCQEMEALYDDVKRASDPIIKQHRQPGGLSNIAGRYFDGKDSTKSAQLAHILQGAESEALRACIGVAGPSLTLLQHDGFTSRERLSVDDIERAVFDRTGYRLRLSEVQL